jgi:hypothetical protein
VYMYLPGIYIRNIASTLSLMILANILGLPSTTASQYRGGAQPFTYRYAYSDRCVDNAGIDSDKERIHIKQSIGQSNLFKCAMLGRSVVLTYRRTRVQHTLPIHSIRQV